MEVIQNSFNTFEIRMLQQMASSHTPEYIAKMMDRPFKQVNDKLLQMSKEQGLKLFARPSYTRKLKRRDKEKQWADKQLAKPKIKVRDIDHSKLIAVYIDRKTTIYVKPGTDIQEVRKKYTNRK